MKTRACWTEWSGRRPGGYFTAIKKECANVTIKKEKGLYVIECLDKVYEETSLTVIKLAEDKGYIVKKRNLDFIEKY